MCMLCMCSHKILQDPYKNKRHGGVRSQMQLGPPTTHPGDTGFHALKVKQISEVSLTLIITNSIK